MDKEDILQNKLNMHLKRNVVLTYQGTKYVAGLNLTLQYMSQLKVLEGDIEMTDIPVENIQNYLKQEGFFDYEQRN